MEYYRHARALATKNGQHYTRQERKSVARPAERCVLNDYPFAAPRSAFLREPPDPPIEPRSIHGTLANFNSIPLAPSALPRNAQ